MSARAVTPKTGHARALAPDGTTLAETKEWFEVEGNVYFPPGAVKRELFEGTDLSTYCPWKGDASYYSVKVGGDKLENAAWYYHEPYETAEKFKDYVAFYKAKINVVVD